MKLLLLCLLLCILNASGFCKSQDFLRVCYYIPFEPPPEKLNSTLCTHIIAGFASVKDGLLYVGNDTQIMQYLLTTDLKRTNPELKVLLTVGGGGNANGFSNAFNSTSNRTRFIFSALASLNKYNFDGLDVDWEFPVWNDLYPPDKQNFNFFLQEFHLLAKMYSLLVGKPSALLTVAVAAPQNIIDSSYDVPEMAKYVDFINLMSYDYHDFYWYTPFTGFNSPLFNRSVEKAYFATLNTAWSANYWNQLGMPKSKIIVGIPTYSHTYELMDPEMNGVDDPAIRANNEFSYSQVCQLLLNGGSRVFDNESRVPYAYKGRNWVSYEDSSSIKEKAEWIISTGFGGAMTYNLNNDDWRCICDKTPFLLQRVIYDVFSSAKNFIHYV